MPKWSRCLPIGRLVQGAATPTGKHDTCVSGLLTTCTATPGRMVNAVKHCGACSWHALIYHLIMLTPRSRFCDRLPKCRPSRSSRCRTPRGAILVSLECLMIEQSRSATIQKEPTTTSAGTTPMIGIAMAAFSEKTLSLLYLRMTLGTGITS